VRLKPKLTVIDPAFAYDEDAGEQKNVALALYAIANSIVYATDRIAGNAKDETGLAQLNTAVGDMAVELGRVADALVMDDEEDGE
jgi:hypothetical protein